MNAVLDQLRSETRALHDALESTPTLRAAMERPTDPKAHGDYLEAMAISVWPLVQALLDSPGTTDASLLPDPSAWESLAADLAALGRPWPRQAPNPPPRADADGAWGRLYVVRGAEAGVMVMARHIAKAGASLSLPSSFASRFAIRRSEWPALCAALGGLSELGAQRAADVARDDFRFALASITAWEHERFPPLVA